MKVCVDISRCFDCPYNKSSVEDLEPRCVAIHDVRKLNYYDIYERIPEWCPFKEEKI